MIKATLNTNCYTKKTNPILEVVNLSFFGQLDLYRCPIGER